MRTLTISDETPTGETLGSCTLDFLTERITVRELIHRRVYEEVHEHNLNAPSFPHMMVTPTAAEQTLNHYRATIRRHLNPERLANNAVRAFEKNGFFVLVDNQQVCDLDAEIDINVDTSVSFIRLVPLVGG